MVRRLPSYVPAEGLAKKKQDKKRGRARDRTGIARIRIWSDDHYTTQPEVLILGK
jgi:hypothetical protein